MDRRVFLAHSIRLTAISGVTFNLTGCGTVLHSERVGQPHSRDIDWSVAAMNGLGLLLFFVPGAIAFAVDFYTGAIYLPEENYDPNWSGPEQIGSNVPQAKIPRQQLTRIELDIDSRNVPSVEKIVSGKIGRKVNLTDQSTRVSQLAKIDQFFVSRQRHLNDANFGQASELFFENLPSA